MYSEDDLQSAIAAGVISSEAAEALRTHVAGLRSAPVVDEENFRLIASFNDVFVTIAAIMLLVALGGIGGAIHPTVAAALVAGASWGLAEFFTLKRRMALPSIVLLVSFVGGVVGTLMTLFGSLGLENDRVEATLMAVAFVGGAVAAWVHWRRFMVPITVAAGSASVIGVICALIVAGVGPDSDVDFSDIFLPLAFVSGLAVFAFAMRWDISDRERKTRRSDVAFWLHLLAAPLIAHPVFYWIGVISGDEIGPAEVIAVLVVYLAMGLVALIVDRRALLVSALVYVLLAVTWLFDRFGAVELNVALTSLVIGSGLLCLSAFWTPIRRAVVDKLPAAAREKLPVLGVVPN
jgi:hypothetical protein